MQVSCLYVHALKHCSALSSITWEFLNRRFGGSKHPKLHVCDYVCVHCRVSDDWGFDNVFMPPNDKWLPPGGGLTFKWGAGENIEPQHTAVSGYAGAGKRSTACTGTKTFKNQDEHTTSIVPHTNTQIRQHWIRMWRKEKGVRCENSWRPGGESESRREFVGVQNLSYCWEFI